MVYSSSVRQLSEIFLFFGADTEPELTLSGSKSERRYCPAASGEGKQNLYAKSQKRSQPLRKKVTELLPTRERNNYGIGADP
jgi:hypothetical protein